MARQPPPLTEKSSMQWRLKPMRQDPLDALGFVSKGDNRLLSTKVQDGYYRSIVSRYMQFCAKHGRDLDATFVALAKDSSPSRTHTEHSGRTVSEICLSAERESTTSNQSLQSRTINAAQRDELSRILQALRKLREGVLGSSSIAQSPLFAQRIHVFNIRVAILAQNPESYHPSLTYLLNVLHTRKHPLPRSELAEMTTYAILDYALRQNDLIAAYDLKYHSSRRFGYANKQVDALLQAVVLDNWVAFWRVRRDVDGYVRALMEIYLAIMRRTVLKAFGRAYLKTDVDWVLRNATGSEMAWEELVQVEQVGWQRYEHTITIRKPKAR